jgi:Pentapeptide repeats (8 copies)
MADQGGWPQRRAWYLQWAKASNAERLNMIWRDNRSLVVTIGLVTVGVSAWWFWDHVAAFGGWLDTYSETIRNLMLAVGVGAAIFGGWVAYRRSQTDRIHAETDRLRQVTESFEGAVTLLGHEDRSVRLGAIYAFERIARQNREEHWPIMETLTAYVRERSPWTRQSGKQTAEAEQEGAVEPPETDVQAALTVIGRRRLEHEEERQRLHLSGTDLRSAMLDRAHLEGALLYGAHLEGADLHGA